MQVVKKAMISILFLVLLLSHSLTAFASEAEDGSDDESDLYIRMETITQRSYSGTAVTDRYDIDILTEESYEQAKAIAARQEHLYIMTQNSLFSIEARANSGDPVAAAVEQLGLFDHSYELTNIKQEQNTAADNIWLTVFLLFLGSGAGMVLAVVLQKWKGGQTS